LKFSDPLGLSCDALPSKNKGFTYGTVCDGLQDDDETDQGNFLSSGLASGSLGVTSAVYEFNSSNFVGLAADQCAEGYQPGIIYTAIHQCPEVPSPLSEPQAAPTQTSNVPSSDPPGDTGGGGGGNGGGNGGTDEQSHIAPAPTSLLRWNSCVAGAIGKGLAKGAFDAIGLVPEMGGIARMLGHGAGYRGVVATHAGVELIESTHHAVEAGAGISEILDTSPEGLISTGITIISFVPGLGQAAAGLSIGFDFYKMGTGVRSCN
jgi:hypothetical protein